MPSIEPETFDLPLAKRQKLEPGHAGQEKQRQQQQQQQPGSRIFSPFRTLGLVSPTKVPFTSVALGKTTFQITTSAGLSLQTYDLRRGLSLVFLSRPETPATITAICAWKDRVLAAWGGASPTEPSGVWVFKRGKRVAELAGPPGPSGPTEQLLVFGSWIVGCGTRTIEVWKSTTLEHYTTLTPTSGAATAGSSSTGPVLTGRICNMPTYLNKVFVGRCDGGVDIWNVRTGKLIYTILPVVPDAGAVTALQPAPVLSLMAIAYSNGALAIHNIGKDDSLLQLRSSSTNSPPVATISFRSDGLGAGSDGRKAGVMATAGADSGDVTLWDLNNGGKIAGVLRDAHEAAGQGRLSGVTKVEFLGGQPVMVSTGMDNALRTWIFDETPFSPVPRPLHARSGHSAPITTIKFLPAASDGDDATGKWLLTAGQDRSLYGLSLRRDSQNAELSQGKIKSKAKQIGQMHGIIAQTVRTDDLKTPEITCIACSLNRDGGMGAAANGPVWANAKATNAESTKITGWESVVTGHKGDKYARTWIWGKKKAGRWALETGDGTGVKSVAVSPCGTFALVGSAGGCIDMYNLQSGMRRQSYPPRLTPAQARKARLMQLTALEGGEEARNSNPSSNRGKHLKAVTGLMIDSLNTTVVSCGLDGKVKFWDFNTGELTGELDWHPMCAITSLRHNDASDLIALSCDDLSIRVIDMETKKLVREFWGCVGHVNDFCMSNDGRWVVAASMDSVVRVWDLPTGHLIDAFRLKKTCTSLAFSTTGEFLATAHADDVGINLWNNRSLFTHVPTSHIDEDAIAEIAGPSASGELGVTSIEAAFGENQDPDSQERPSMTAEQLGSNMMTLSITPKNRWQTLLHLEQIKERNKPKEAPQKPQKAPFFLPSTLGKPNSTSLAELTNPSEDAEIDALKLAAERSRITKLQRTNGANLQISQFTSLLQASGRTGDFTAFIDYFKSLSPAKADLEIRSLSSIARGYGNELATFVRALTARLQAKRDFELVNTWMAVFLRVHGDAAGILDAENGEEEGENERQQHGMELDGQQEKVSLPEALAEFKVEQARESKRLGDLVGYCRGIIGFLRSAR